MAVPYPVCGHSSVCSVGYLQSEAASDETADKGTEEERGSGLQVTRGKAPHSGRWPPTWTFSLLTVQAAGGEGDPDAAAPATARVEARG